MEEARSFTVALGGSAGNIAVALGNAAARSFLWAPRDKRGGNTAFFEKYAPQLLVINGIDTSDAAGMPGVIAIFTAADLGLEPVPSEFNPGVARGLLAIDKVRFVGEPVAVFGPWGCGKCPACHRGQDTYCAAPLDGYDSAFGGGLGTDGGQAEYMLVPDARFLVPIPDALDPVAAAGLRFRKVNVKEAFTLCDAAGQYFRASLTALSDAHAEAVVYEAMPAAPPANQTHQIPRPRRSGPVTTNACKTTLKSVS